MLLKAKVYLQTPTKPQAMLQSTKHDRTCPASVEPIYMWAMDKNYNKG
jgi:hypothetical protein